MYSIINKTHQLRLCHQNPFFIDTTDKSYVTIVFARRTILASSLERKKIIWYQLISPLCRIYASVNWGSIGSDNGLSPIGRQAII